MGFSRLLNIKSKFAASVAIVATIFSAFAGAVPAHATASSYSSSGHASVKMLYTADLGSGMSFTLPNGVTTAKTNISLYFGSTAVAAFSGHNVKLSYTLTGPNGVVATTGSSLTDAYVYNSVYGNANGSINISNGPGGNYSDSTGYAVPVGSTSLNMNLMPTLQTNMGMPGTTQANIPAGTYTFALSVQKDGVDYPIDGTTNGLQMQQKTEQWVVDGASQTNSQAYSSVVGVGVVCVDTTAVSAGDTVVVHMVSNGADDAGNLNSTSIFYGSTGSSLTYQSSTQTVSASWVAAGSTLAFAGTGGNASLSATSGATNTFDITVTKGGVDVSRSCNSTPATPTLSVSNTVNQSLQVSSTSSITGCSIYLSTDTTNAVGTGNAMGGGMPCSVYNPRNGVTYVAKATSSLSYYFQPYNALTQANWTFTGTSGISNAVTVSGAGYNPTLSGASTVGAASITANTATLPAASGILTSSDGGSGMLYLGYQAQNNCISSYCTDFTSGAQIKIGHVTTAGADSSFAGSGTFTTTQAGTGNYIQIASGATGLLQAAPAWYGNRDKWAAAVTYASGATTYGMGFITGTFGSATTSTTTVAGSVLESFCTTNAGASFTNYGAVTPISMASSVPLYRVECGNNYSRWLKVDLYFTVTNATTLALVLNTQNGGSTNDEILSASSVNPTASASDVALTLVYANANATGWNYMTNSATAVIASRTIFRLKNDLTQATSPVASSWSANTNPASETKMALSVNNNGTAYAVTNSGDVRTLGATGDFGTRLVLTDDQAATFSATPLLTIPGAAQTVSGTLFVQRINAANTRVATAKIDLSTGAVTTGEVATMTFVRGFGTSSTFAYDASQNLYWYYTPTSGLSNLAIAKWRNFTVVTGPSSDSSATITVNGASVSNGGTVHVNNNVTAPTVVVTATDAGATVGIVSGASSLALGNNTVTVTVTAADNTTTNYSFTIVRDAVVLPTYVLSFDKNNSSATGTTASVSATSGWAAATNGYSLTNYSFTGWNTLANGNGTAYAAGASITLTADTVLYAQWLRDPYVLTFNGNTGASGTMANATSRTSWTLPSTVGFTKANNFFSGWNTAANGSGTSYAVGASVTASADTTLYAQWTAIPSDGVLCPAGTYSASHGGYSSVTNSWTCTDAPAGSYVSTTGSLAASLCAAGYFAANPASTACIPASVGHFVALAGAAAEVACAANTHAYNTGAIACDPDRVLSSNKKASFLVAGKPAANGSVVEITGVPTSIGVMVNLADNRANATVSVPAVPALGNNLVTVFVYAEDGSVQESNITVHISAPVVTPPIVVPPTPVLSSDATAAIKANGTAVAEGGVINLPAGTTSVAVTVTPTESHANATVAGATALVTGNNTVTVTVTAQDGSKKTYSFTAAVAAPLSADATATITVAGITVNDGDHINLPFGTNQVAVAVTPTESHATYSVAGATGLANGTSVLTVTVTAQNGATKAYSYQLVVAADTTPVNVSGSSVSVLDRVKAALAAGRAAMVTFSAKGAAAHASVVSQIRTFKAAARAAGISGRISFSITDASNSATGVVRVG